MHLFTTTQAIELCMPGPKGCYMEAVRALHEMAKYIRKVVLYDLKLSIKGHPSWDAWMVEDTTHWGTLNAMLEREEMIELGLSPSLVWDN